MPYSHRISRRAMVLSFIAAAGITAASVIPSGPATAQDMRDITMRLDWVYQAPNAGFIVAKEKGFYKDAGLNVEVGPGKGSGSTAQLVASKATQFGFADGYVVANSVAKGMDLTMVGSVYRRNPTAVVTLADSGINEPKDLEGKTIAIPTGATQFQQWPAFVKGCNLDADKIKIVNIDPAGSVPALVTGKVDAIAGYAQGYVPGVEVRAGKKAKILWYADCGVTSVSNGIIVHNDTLKEDPELVRKFVEASIRGFLYARENRDEAIEIIRKYSESADPEILKREFELSWNTWVTPGTRGKPLGWMSPEEWQQTVANLKQYGNVETDIKAESLYTNELVPGGDQYVPPQPTTN